MNVGAFSLSPAVMVAPMAGVTDLPFRETAVNHSGVKYIFKGY